MAATMGSTIAQAQSASASATAGGASAQAGGSQPIVGQPHCGPWMIAWYVSYGGYWYGWSWRWCYNPSLGPNNAWYVDWASWAWGGYAGPGYAPGYYYSVPAGPGPG